MRWIRTLTGGYWPFCMLPCPYVADALLQCAIVDTVCGQVYSGSLFKTGSVFMDTEYDAYTDSIGCSVFAPFTPSQISPYCSQPTNENHIWAFLRYRNIRQNDPAELSYFVFHMSHVMNFIKLTIFYLWLIWSKIWHQCSEFQEMSTSTMFKLVLTSMELCHGFLLTSCEA